MQIYTSIHIDLSNEKSWNRGQRGYSLAGAVGGPCPLCCIFILGLSLHL